MPLTSATQQKAIAMDSIVHGDSLRLFYLQMHREFGKGVSHVDFFLMLYFFVKESVAVLGSIIACLC